VAGRFFAAIDLPSAITDLLVDLNPGIKGLRWVPREQMHLTLSFLENVPPEAEGRLIEKLDDVSVPPFFLPLQGVATFSRKSRPSVVWTGVGSAHPHLFVLHRRVQDAVLAAGLEPDLKPFRPHVTIGRARNVSAATLRPFLRKHENAEFGLIYVTGFTLYSSVLSREGARHRQVFQKEFPA
jgi:2'-5' RNA ligase